MLAGTLLLPLTLDGGRLRCKWSVRGEAARCGTKAPL